MTLISLKESFHKMQEALDIAISDLKLRMN